MTNIKNEVNEESAIQEDDEEIVESNDDGVMEISMDDLEALIGSEGGKINISELLETEMVRSRTLYLNEEVTLDTVNHIIQLIHKFNRDDSEIEVKDRIPCVIYIDSVGGEIWRGQSLISTIESSLTPIIGVLQGTCFSMALPIWQSCHVRYASRFASVMYHTLRGETPMQSLVEMENQLKYLQNLQKQLDKYILSKTSIPKKLLKKKRKSNLDWFISIKEMEKYEMYDYLID